MRKVFFFICALLVSTGCAKIQHLPQLLTLKDLQDDGILLQKDIDAYNKKFQALIEAYKAGQLAQYPDQKSIRKNFGAPIQKKEVLLKDMVVDRWLYHRAVKYYGKEKIYLFFTKDGKLMSWEYVPGEQKKEANPNGKD